MKPLATFEHISSKNANYGDAEKYLTFAHDEFTMKPTLDADGRLVPRENYRISTLNCGEEVFAVACMRSNLRYGKNQKREDVKIRCRVDGKRENQRFFLASRKSFSLELMTSVMNMWPGAWVIAMGGFAFSTAACGVTPQGQNTGISPS